MTEKNRLRHVVRTVRVDFFAMEMGFSHCVTSSYRLFTNRCCICFTFKCFVARVVVALGIWTFRTLDYSYHVARLTNINTRIYDGRFLPKCAFLVQLPTNKRTCVLCGAAFMSCFAKRLGRPTQCLRSPAVHREIRLPPRKKII